MLRTETVLNGADHVLMTNPYALRALAQAREEDIRRAFTGRHQLERHAFGRRDLRSVLFGWRRPRRAPVVLRVVLTPLDPPSLGGPDTFSEAAKLPEPAKFRGQITFGDLAPFDAHADARLRCQQ